MVQGAIRVTTTVATIVAMTEAATIAMTTGTTTAGHTGHYLNLQEVILWIITGRIDSQVIYFDSLLMSPDCN